MPSEKEEVGVEAPIEDMAADEVVEVSDEAVSLAEEMYERDQEILGEDPKADTGDDEADGPDEVVDIDDTPAADDSLDDGEPGAEDDVPVDSGGSSNESIEQYRNLAISAGVPPEKMAGFTTVEQMRTYLTGYVDQLEAAEAARSSQTDQAAKVEFELKHNIDPDEFDEGVVQLGSDVRALHEHYTGKIASLEGQVNQLMSAMSGIAEMSAKQSRQQEDDWIKGKIQKLPQELQSAFEKDAALSQKLYDDMLDLQAGRRARKQSLIPPDELFDRAIGGRFSSEQMKLAKSGLSQKINGQARRANHRPTGKRSDEDLSGMESALQRIQKQMG